MLGLGFQAGSPVFAHAPNAAADPASLALSYWERDYAGTSPLAGTASAGTSGSVSLAGFGGTEPAAGTAVNGHTPANYNGTTNWMWTSPTTLDSIIGTGTNAGTAGSIAVLFNTTTAVADNASAFNLPGIVCHHNSGSFVIAFSVAGVRVAVNDGTNHEMAVACGTGAWHLLVVTMTGTAVNVYLDNMVTPATSAVSGLPSTGANPVKDGANFNQTVFYAGKIMERLGAKNIAWDATQRALIKSYVQGRYPAMGL